MSFTVFKAGIPKGRKSEYEKIIEALIDAGEGHDARTNLFSAQVPTLRKYAKKKGYKLYSYHDPNNNVCVWIEPLESEATK